MAAPQQSVDVTALFFSEIAVSLPVRREMLT